MIDLTIMRFDTMRTIFAEYNPQCNSIDVYTSADYMLRIDCWEAEKNLKTTPGSDSNDLSYISLPHFLL